MAQSSAVMPRDRGGYARLACEGAFWSSASGRGGSRYRDGTGVKRNDAEAVEWYRKAFKYAEAG